MISAQSEANSEPTATKHKSKFDTVIVFGQGPVKPVFLEEEVTTEQLSAWKAYRDNPFSTKEPEYWIIQQPKYLQQIARIKEEAKITDEEKAKLIELKRQEWQRMGWFGMKTLGRQNALAAGYALYKGLTRQVVFTGGRTMSKWAAEFLPQDRRATWPSEASLMKDIVVSHYGDMYEKKFGRMIDDAVLIEDASTNTLENISFVLNKYPQILDDETRIGYLSARHHLRRIKLLANLFSLQCEHDEQLLAAQELVEQAQTSVVESIDSQTSPVDEKNYLDAKTLSDREERWRRGLKEPEYVTYWLGYLADVKYPRLIQKTLRRLYNEEWRSCTSKALAKVGVNFEAYKDVDLCLLAKESPEKYASLVERLKMLKAPEHRLLPAQLTIA